MVNMGYDAKVSYFLHAHFVLKRKGIQKNGYAYEPPL